MHRDYTDGEASDVSFFVGNEIEKTSCHGMKTLFVVGESHTADQIADVANLACCEHIYLGANKSFREYFSVRNLMNRAYALTSMGFHVTIDVPFHSIGMFSEVDDDLIHFNISVELPNIKRLKNVNIKVDDVDFKATNPGVWVFDLNKSQSNFTDWSEYSNDEILKGK